MKCPDHPEHGAFACPCYWIDVSANVVAWLVVIAAVLVVERALVGRPVPELHV